MTPDKMLIENPQSAIPSNRKTTWFLRFTGGGCKPVLKPHHCQTGRCPQVVGVKQQINETIHLAHRLIISIHFNATLRNRQGPSKNEGV